MDTHDLNQSLMEFPCEFPIKAMGRAEPGFVKQVVSLVENHVPYVPKQAVKSAHSRKGNYLSVTILITATSKEQLDNIYRELTECEDVIVAL